MRSSSSYRAFGALFVASLAIWWRPLLATAGLALSEDTCTQISLILPISVALITTAWRQKHWKPLPKPATGLPLLFLAVVVSAAAWSLRRGEIITADVSLSLQMFGLVTWWIGSFLACFGAGIGRGCIFPLGFLLWMIPIPEFVLNRLVQFLQVSSATAARLFFGLAHIPVSQDGTMLALPGLTIEVARECSSIRSSLMLMIITMVTAHLLLRSGWGKTLVILAAIPLSIAKNGLRIFTLATLSVYVDPSYMNGQLHHQGGVLFLLVSLAVLAVVLASTAWLEGKSDRKPRVPMSSLVHAAHHPNS